MPTSIDGAIPPPNRVIMKLKPPDRNTASGTRLFQKLRSPPSRTVAAAAVAISAADSMDYAANNQYYSPQLHVGGRGRFGVVGSGPPPSQPMPEKLEDFNYLPPQIVSDHCYGKTPPITTTSHMSGGHQQASSSSTSANDHHQQQHVMTTNYCGGKVGRLIPTTGHVAYSTTTIAQQQQQQSPSIGYHHQRGRLVHVTQQQMSNTSLQQHHNYESRRLRTNIAVGANNHHQLQHHDHSESPPSNYSRTAVGNEYLSEGLGEGYADNGTMQQVVAGFEATGSMMPGGSSLIGVDKMPANILDDGDELTDSAIDIQ